MFARLGEQTYILRADYPRLDAFVIGDLHVLAVCLQCLQNFDLMAFHYGFQRRSQDVVLLHMVIYRHRRVHKSLFGTDKLISQVEEFLKPFAPKYKLGLLC